MRSALILVWLAFGITATASAAEGGQPIPETELGKLAASLQPGEMKELKTKGLTRNLIKSWYDWDHDAKGTRIYGAQAMFEIMTGNWSNDAKWDPVTRQVLYIGIGHYAAMKFVTYSADSNEWRLEPVPPWADPRSIKGQVAEVLPGGRVKLSIGKTHALTVGDLLFVERDGKAVGRVKVLEVGETESVAEVYGKDVEVRAGDQVRNGNREKREWPRGHMYDRLAISPELRLLGVNWFGLHLYDIDRKEWLPSVKTASGGKDAYQIMEYFPEMKAFVYECNWGRDLRLWDVEKKAERQVGSYPFGMHGVMEYNPVYKVMIFGGGDGCKDLYRMDADGKVVRLSPMPVGVSCTEACKFICDPVSGEYLIQARHPEKREPGVLYAFHPMRDEWQEIPGLKLPSGIGFGVNTYGVVMLCTANQVFVYKHKPVWPGSNPPAAKQGKE